MGTLAASTQCWRMAKALRSHSRCWLVVSSDKMSLCASHSWTSSVERTLLWSRWQQKLAGPIKRPSSSTVTSPHNITGSVAFFYKSHRLSTTLRPLNYVVLYTTIMHRFKVRSFFGWNSIGCRPVTSSFSDDPLTQFTAKPFFLQCKQAREPTYGCQRLKANII